jgi:hypothetical protein
MYLIARAIAIVKKTDDAYLILKKDMGEKFRFSACKTI